MKRFTLIPILFLASCASHPQLALRPAAPSAVEPVETVRYAEVVRAYHVGRYVDPNHPETMNEQHSVYRIETSARWNLHPRSLTTANLLNPPPDAAFAPPPANDVVLAEMNRQREITGRVMQEAARLARSYDELQQVVSDMKNVARNHVLMGTRLSNTEQRVAEFEKTLQRLANSPSPATNESPVLTPEPPGSLKP